MSGSAPSWAVGSSIAMEKTLASVLESTPVHGDVPPRCGAVKLRPPVVSNRFLMPSKSKKNASLRAPAKNVKLSSCAMFGVGPKDTSTASKIFSPTAYGDSASSFTARNTSTVCRPSAGSEKTKLNAMSFCRSPSLSMASR